MKASHGRIGGYPRTCRAGLKAQRRQILEWLIRQHGAAWPAAIACACRIEQDQIHNVLDHWWFQRTPAGTWPSEDGIRELAGTQKRDYGTTA